MKNFCEYIYKNIFEIFLIAIVIGTIVLFLPSIKDNKLPGYNDVLEFLNWNTQIHKALKNREFPLWSPTEMAGLPFAAQYQPAIFYPFTYLLFFISPQKYITFIMIFHYIITPLLMYLFLRFLEFEKIVCLIASLIWSYSGYMIMRYWVGQYSYIMAFSYTPLILYCYIIALKTANLIIFWAVVIPAALQFFTGAPEIIFYTHILIFLFSIKFLISKQINLKNLFLRFSGYYFLFFCLTIIQILPLLEFLPYSIRGKSFEYSTFLSFPFKNLITMLLPYFYGSHTDGNFWGAQNYFELYAYVGILPIFLLIFVNKIFNVGDKQLKIEILFCGFLVLLGLFLALGKYSPFYRYIINIIVPFSKLRAPSRALFISLFGWTLLTANILQTIIDSSDFKQFRKHLIIIFVFSLIILILYYIPPNTVVSLITKFFDIPNIALKYQTFHFKLKHLAVVLVLYSNFFLDWRDFNKKTMLLLILSVVFYETFIFNTYYIDYRGTNIDFSNNALIKELKKDNEYFRLLSFEHLIEMPKYNINNISTAISYTPTQLKTICDYLAIGVDNRKNYITESYKSWFGIQKIDNYNSPLLDLLNVKYYYNYNISDNDKFTKIADNLYKKNTFVERFRFYYDWRCEDNLHNSLELLKNQQIDYFNTVIVNNAEISPLQRYGTQNTIKSIKYNFNSIILNVEINTDAVLFTSEIYYPGWQVKLDGKGAFLLKLNNIFRGVYCYKGAQTIEFYYRPYYIRYGFLGLIIFIVCGLIFVLNIYSKKYEN